MPLCWDCFPPLVPRTPASKRQPARRRERFFTLRSESGASEQKNKKKKGRWQAHKWHKHVHRTHRKYLRTHSREDSSRNSYTHFKQKSACVCVFMLEINADTILHVPHCQQIPLNDQNNQSFRLHFLSVPRAARLPLKM